jgi:hypothetical protein
VALSSLDNHPNVNGGAANKQYHPGHGCHKKHPHKPKKCVRPPKAYTGPVHHVGKHSAELTGRVVVYGHLRTRYYFVYGVCPHMNHRVGFGRTSSSRKISVTITGLKAGTKYCYEAVATNSRGTGRGRVRSFHTQGSKGTGHNGHGHNGHGHNDHGHNGHGHNGHHHHKKHGQRQPSQPAGNKRRGFTG